MRHRPFGIAGPRQEPPSRRRAPLRGAAFAPLRRSQIILDAWGALLIFGTLPPAPSPRVPARGGHGTTTQTEKEAQAFYRAEGYREIGRSIPTLTIGFKSTCSVAARR